MKRSSKNANKLERNQQKREAMDYYQSGSGLFLFRNRSKVASLELPKVSADGKKWIEPGQTWKGDSYFMSLVPREATLVETLTEQKKEEVKMQDRLILDQPDQVTTAGKVEHAVVQDDVAINEVSPHEAKTKDKLLTEDPLAGVTIIRD
jgi:hypothetical protein